MLKKSIVRVSALAITGLLALGAGCNQTATKTTTPNNTTKTTNATTNTNAAVVAFNGYASAAAILSDANGQWAKTAVASTEYGSDSWSAKQATGKPNVTVYGDNGYAWAPAEKNKGIETLELSFAQVVTPLGVRVLESYGSGALTKVELKDTTGVYRTVWGGNDVTTGLSYIQIAVAGASYQTDTVKLTFDSTLAPEEWVEVDAVQLVGE